MKRSEWPGGYRHAIHQDEHRAYNANHYPGTRQLCCRCEAEIGSIKRGWHTCGRRATLESVRHLGLTVYYLYFCERHRKRAEQPESQLVRVSQVRAVEW